MSDMVEKLKAAFEAAADAWFAKNPGANDDQWAEAELDVYAAAALVAMREPTDAMVDAAVAPYRHEATEQFMATYRETVRGYARAMADAADV